MISQIVAVAGVGRGFRAKYKRRTHLRGCGPDLECCTYASAIHDPASSDNRELGVLGQYVHQDVRAEFFIIRFGIEHPSVSSRFYTLSDKGINTRLLNRDGFAEIGCGSQGVDANVLQRLDLFFRRNTKVKADDVWALLKQQFKYRSVFEKTFVDLLQVVRCLYTQAVEEW